MGLKERLTPKNTEEVRPNLFVQGKGNKYRIVHPLVWNGNWRVKEQLKTIFSLRTLLSLGFVLFLVWSYVHDTTVTREFYYMVKQNPVEWCNEVLAGIPTGDLCNKQWEEFGLCDRNETLNNIYSINVTEILG